LLILSTDSGYLALVLCIFTQAGKLFMIAFTFSEIYLS